MLSPDSALYYLFMALALFPYLPRVVSILLRAMHSNYRRAAAVRPFQAVPTGVALACAITVIADRSLQDFRGATAILRPLDAHTS